MPTNFPSSLDSLSNPTGTDMQDVVPHSSQHSNANDAIEALEAKVGINGSTDPSSLDYKVTQLNPLTTKGDIIVRSATANDRLPVGADGQMLVADSTQPLGVKYTNPTSGGTVTTASVVSANGFTGSVANPTTTPAITLTTSVTGVLKGNGTAMSAATQGTDYYAPSGTDVSVADGGTGVSSLTAYAPIFGGTTGTGAVQSGTVGSAGQVLTSNGGSAIATFQTPQGWILLHNGTVTSIDDSPKYDTGTLTSYDRYMLVFELKGTQALDIGLQVNGQTSGIYISTQYFNTSIGTTGSTTATILATASVSPIGYETGGTYFVRAKGSNKFIYGSGFAGARLLDSAISYSGDITSFQLFRFSGTGEFSGFFKVYGQNN